MSIRTEVILGAALLCAICLTVLAKLPHPEVIESANDARRLKEIMREWGAGGGVRIGFALGFDFLFMAAYVAMIGLGCAAAAEYSDGVLKSIGVLLAYAQIVTGLIDAAENSALTRILLAGFDEELMQIARLATASKFVFRSRAWSIS
jgi:hypothetical protein